MFLGIVFLGATARGARDPILWGMVLVMRHGAQVARARTCRQIRHLGLGLLVALCCTFGGATDALASPEPEGPAQPPAIVAVPAADVEADTGDAAKLRRREPSTRRFMVGLEGVALQTAPLHTRLIRFDRRYIGQNTTLGGAGIFGRWRANDRVALDLGVRSGTLRVERAEGEELVAQDLLLAELGALLYIAHGEIGHLAVDGGVGGLGNQIRYSGSDGREGTQRVGAALFRAGLDIELLLNRLAFVISLRAYGVITDRKRTRSEGTIFEGVEPSLRLAPVPVFQTHMIGAAGVAYRF